MSAKVTTSVRVAVCVNDEHGSCMRRIGHVHISEGDPADVVLELECPELYESRWPAFDWVGFDRIRVSRRLFRRSGRVDGVGNVFWSETVMRRREALRLVAYLRERGWQDSMWVETSPFAPASSRTLEPRA